jgi:hypothetical protein
MTMRIATLAALAMLAVPATGRSTPVTAPPRPEVSNWPGSPEGEAEREAADRVACREWVEAGEPPRSPPWDVSQTSVYNPCHGEAGEEAARKEVREKDRAARDAERQMPVKYLSVRSITHQGHSLDDPGYTDLEISTSQYAYVTVQLTRYGRETWHYEGGGSLEIPWTCSRPGAAYRYTVTARSNVGNTLARRGSFEPVTVRRCHELRHASLPL